MDGVQRLRCRRTGRCTGLTAAAWRRDGAFVPPKMEPREAAAWPNGAEKAGVEGVMADCRRGSGRFYSRNGNRGVGSEAECASDEVSMSWPSIKTPRWW